VTFGSGPRSGSTSPSLFHFPIATSRGEQSALQTDFNKNAVRPRAAKYPTELLTPGIGLIISQPTPAPEVLATYRCPTTPTETTQQ
jgi:hypothetical protein